MSLMAEREEIAMAWLLDLRYTLSSEACGVRVSRAEVQRLDPPCDDDAVRDVVLGEEALGTSTAVPPQWRESGLGLWKVVWVVGRREAKTGEESRQRVSWRPRNWEERASAWTF